MALADLTTIDRARLSRRSALDYDVAQQADAEAWLLRLAALATALDQETDRIRHDAGISVIPPDFVVARTIAQITDLREGSPLQSALIEPTPQPTALRRAAPDRPGATRR